MQRPALALAAILVSAGAGLLAGPAEAAPFSVNSVDDETDAAIDGTCDSGPAPGAECTLRAAVQEANATPAADTIILTSFGFPYQLTLGGPDDDTAATGDLDLTEPVTIQGTGQPLIDGMGADRVLDVGPSGNPAVTVSGVEVRDGGGVTAGAGIRVLGGTLSLSGSTIAGNTATSAAGSAEGGGILIDTPGSHSIASSTFDGNAAGGLTGAAGGALDVEDSGASVSVLNSTVNGNQATAGPGTARGGGVASRGSLVLTHTTMDQNSAEAGGTIASQGGTVSLRATIVAAGLALPGSENCSASGGSILTLGANLEALGTFSSSQCGLSATTLDRFAIDAALAPLDDRGGPTRTQAPFSSSLALDAVPSCFPVGIDQRGQPRPSGVACEIGSYERQVKAPPGTGCFGLAPTIIGTITSERIQGTPGPDVISAEGGNDVIEGGGGTDLICAGKGKDRLLGEEGDDRMAGEDGDDKVMGQAGNDNLLGNAGKDLLKGGGGRDTLNGGANRDKCRGGGPDKFRNCDRSKRRPVAP